MERRKFVIGLGALASGTAAAVGTGAFTSASAERSASVTTAGDKSALLGLEANEDYSGDQDVYVGTSDYDTIELTFEDVNRNATTRFDDLIKVTNNGTDNVQIRVSNDFGASGVHAGEEQDVIYGSGYGSDGPMDIQYNGDSIVGGNNNQVDTNLVLEPGDSATLDVEIDISAEKGEDSWADSEIQIIAS